MAVFSDIRSYFVVAIVIFAALPILMWIFKELSGRLYARLVPETEFSADVVSRRVEVKSKDDKTKTAYFVLFELNDGTRMEFETDIEDYAYNIEGDRGKLILREKKWAFKNGRSEKWLFVKFTNGKSMR